jgi:hypothetical protein
MPKRKVDPETGEELLTTKEYLFVEYYLGAANLNATKAAIMAGYSLKSARDVGCENLTKPNILAQIENRKLEAKYSTDECMRGLADTARASLEDFVDILKNGSWKLNLKKAEMRGKLHLLKKLAFDKRGKPVIELHSSLDAKKTFVGILGLKQADRANQLDEQARIEKLVIAQMEEFGISRDEAIKDLSISMPEIRNYIM